MAENIRSRRGDPLDNSNVFFHNEGNYLTKCEKPLFMREKSVSRITEKLLTKLIGLSSTDDMIKNSFIMYNII